MLKELRCATRALSRVQRSEGQLVCLPQVKQQSLDLLKRRDDKDDLVESQISAESPHHPTPFVDGFNGI